MLYVQRAGSWNDGKVIDHETWDESSKSWALWLASFEHRIPLMFPDDKNSHTKSALKGVSKRAERFELYSWTPAAKINENLIRSGFLVWKLNVTLPDAHATGTPQESLDLKQCLTFITLFQLAQSRTYRRVFLQWASEKPWKIKYRIRDFGH